MTITYTLRVSNSRLFGFSKLLFYWKGSVYKLVYKEMLIFLSVYYAISAVYRWALNDDQQRVFEKIVIYCQNFLDLIPLTFVLGFYVAIVVGRWWQQYMSIPWPDRLMAFVGTLVHGSDERGRLIRRSLMRWLNLSHAMIMQSISICVKKRFPTMQHLVDAGLMTQHEKKKLKDIPTPHNKFWVPTMWFSTLVTQCREEGRIRDDIHLKTILDEVTNFKTSLGMLYSYDWISIPLVYTQVATMAVYGFFFACLMGRQYIESTTEKSHTPIGADLYVPLFTLMQFFFYMGWLKVAEVLINPFGEDEDDFETNWMIDRNYQVAMLAADELYNDIPILEKDLYWDELEPELPYTKSTICHKNEPFMGSTADFSLNPEDTQVVSAMETIPENAPPKHGSHLNIPTTVFTSTTSSPARFRQFFNNITNAFSQESISDSRSKDLHIHSLHNVKDGIKDGIRDPQFYQSPHLQRVRSNSFKRSYSHSEHLSPKHMGSMCNVHVSQGQDSRFPHSHVVSVPVSDVSMGHINSTMVPSPLIQGKDCPRVEVNPLDGETICSGIAIDTSRRQSVNIDQNLAISPIHSNTVMVPTPADSNPSTIPTPIHISPSMVSVPIPPNHSRIPIPIDTISTKPSVCTPVDMSPSLVSTPIHSGANMVPTLVHSSSNVVCPASVHLSAHVIPPALHTTPNVLLTPVHSSDNVLPTAIYTSQTVVHTLPAPSSLQLRDVAVSASFPGHYSNPIPEMNTTNIANCTSVWSQFGDNKKCAPFTETSLVTPSNHPSVLPTPSSLDTSLNHPSVLPTPSSNHTMSLDTSLNHPMTLTMSPNHTMSLDTSLNHPMSLDTSLNHPMSLDTSLNHPMTLTMSPNHPVIFLGNDSFCPAEYSRLSHPAPVWEHDNTASNLNIIDSLTAPRRLSVEPVTLSTDSTFLPVQPAVDALLLEPVVIPIPPSGLSQAGKVDSQYSLDSTGSSYDSSYDTVSSQQPLLDSCQTLEGRQ